MINRPAVISSPAVLLPTSTANHELSAAATNSEDNAYEYEQQQEKNYPAENLCHILSQCQLDLVNPQVNVVLD